MPQKFLCSKALEPPDPALLLGNSQPPSDKGHRKDELPRGTHQSTSGRCPGAHQQEKGKITHCPPRQTQCVPPSLVSREAGLGRGPCDRKPQGSVRPHSWEVGPTPRRGGNTAPQASFSMAPRTGSGTMRRSMT